MKTDDFDFELPLELIAQSPILKRDESKLLVMDRKTGEIKHEHFYNIISKIINYLYKNLILVLKLRHKLKLIILYLLSIVK